MAALYQAPAPQAVDAHTHLDFVALDLDRDDILDRARAAGVTGLVLAGADPADWDRLVAVADEIGAARCLGVHPWWVASRTPEALEAELQDLAARRDLDGIGETGLDWYRAREEGPERTAQRVSFEAHVEVAHQLGLPLVLHIVRAHQEAFGLLAATDVPAAGGMVHAWSAGPDQVGIAVELGLHLSFGAGLARSAKVREACKRVPLDRLLLESDCPDQPFPDRERSEPADLIRIAGIAAEVRDTTPEALLAATGDNARHLFPRLEP